MVFVLLHPFYFNQRHLRLGNERRIITVTGGRCPNSFITDRSQSADLAISRFVVRGFFFLVQHAGSGLFDYSRLCSHYIPQSTPQHPASGRAAERSERIASLLWKVIGR